MRPVHSEDGAQEALRFKKAVRAYALRRAVDATILVQFGDTPLLLRIVNGGVVDIVDAIAPLSSWDFSIRASVGAWLRFWQAVPRPGSHDVFALAKNGEMTIEGDLRLFMANLQYIKDLLAAAREPRA